MNELPLTDQALWWLFAAFVAIVVVLCGCLVSLLLGPIVRAWSPGLAELLSNLLPLGRCRHVDDAGVSVLYHERREVHGRDVMHFVCPTCRFATPVVQPEPLVMARKEVR